MWRTGDTAIAFAVYYCTTCGVFRVVSQVVVVFARQPCVSACVWGAWCTFERRGQQFMGCNVAI